MQVYAVVHQRATPCRWKKDHLSQYPTHLQNTSLPDMVITTDGFIIEGVISQTGNRGVQH